MPLKLSASRRPPLPVKISVSALPAVHPGVLITSVRMAARLVVRCAAPDCPVDHAGTTQPVEATVRGNASRFVKSLPNGGVFALATDVSTILDSGKIGGVGAERDPTVGASQLVEVRPGR